MTDFTKLEEKVLNDMAKDVAYIRRDVDRIMERLEHEYITRDQFEPVKKIVYGMVSIMLVGVVTAIMTLVLRS